MFTEDENLELDLSWTQEYIRLAKSENHPERERMESIQIQFIYVSTLNEVIHTICETHDLITDTANSNNNSLLPNEKTLHLIQSKKEYNGKRFKLTDISLFLVNLESQELFDYSVSVSDSRTFFREIPILGQICIPSSIFIFHKVNRLYFVFREMVRSTPSLVKKVPTSSILHLSTSKMPIKSALISDKNSALEKREGIKNPLSKKTTKRVRISPDIQVFNIGSNNRTSKIRILEN